MFDRGAFWSPPPAWESARIAGEGIAVRAVPVAACWLLSGAFAAQLEALGVATPLGPRDRIAAPRYALRLAPDGVLLVSEEPCEIEAGWRADGVAASDVGDGYIVIEIDGERAPALMAMAAEYPFELPPGNPAESAQLLFAGLRVLVARRTSGWRLHVERPWAAALWRWLEHHAR